MGERGRKIKTRREMETQEDGNMETQMLEGRETETDRQTGNDTQRGKKESFRRGS